MKKILILSGIDSSAGAGLIVDVEIARALGCEVFAVPTAITLQTQKKYEAGYPSPQKQWDDLEKIVARESFHAVKIGMLCDAKTVSQVVRVLAVARKKNPQIKIVWDPVFKSTSGGELLSADGIKLAIRMLLPLCNLVTPNADEMRVFLRCEKKSPDDPEYWIWQFHRRFGVFAYLKGGHLKSRSTDYFFDGQKIHAIKSKRFHKSKRGTGCVFATAAACALTANSDLLRACRFAKKVIGKYLVG